jgi:hypothetical protein
LVVCEAYYSGTACCCVGGSVGGTVVDDDHLIGWTGLGFEEVQEAQK